MDISDYKIKLKTDLLDNFFNSNKSITGKEILSFSKEKQINLFIIFLLMKQWKNDIDKLKSPYFDFKNQEVKDALEVYMNIVSKHILIRKEDFEPLLEKAINYTFQLVENPESFVVSNHLESDLTDLTKYIKYHKPYFEGDLDYEVTNLIEKLKSELGVNNEESIIEESKTPFIKDDLSEDVKTDSINDKLSNDSNTNNRILDAYTDSEKESTLVFKKIDSIKNAISINQKFVFMNDLFGGSIEQYNQTIDRLDKCSGEVEAYSFIENITQEKGETDAKEQLRLLIKQKYNFTAE